MMSLPTEEKKSIAMVDLYTQYLKIKEEVDSAIQSVLNQTAFIKGPDVQAFEEELTQYLGGTHAIGVANGTDALQIAFMAAGIGAGDEVITTPFTFIATAEAAALLGARPVFVDIDPDTFNINPASIEAAITPRTRAIVPVHLFGQPADMQPILALAEAYHLTVIEDNAQSIGAEYQGRKAGYIGDMGTLSFFPSKNLGCYGDGGAVLTSDNELAQRIRMIANHGAKRKYYHEEVGVNSRLDTLQAAILRVKLRHLDAYITARQQAAAYYDELLADHEQIQTPFVRPDRTHVFHQYTLRIHGLTSEKRQVLQARLKEQGIPTAVYYPVPLHQLPVFADKQISLPEAERAAQEVLSLPMHTELTTDQQTFIIDTLLKTLRELG